MPLTPYFDREQRQIPLIWQALFDKTNNLACPLCVGIGVEFKLLAFNYALRQQKDSLKYWGMRKNRQYPDYALGVFPSARPVLMGHVKIV